MIKDHFNLPGPSHAEMMNRVKLEEVRDDELPQLHQMQKDARVPVSKNKYYFIVKDGARVGAISPDSNDASLFILPQYQNQGIEEVAKEQAKKL